MLKLRLLLVTLVFFALLVPCRALAYPYLSMAPSACAWHNVASPSMNSDGNELLSVSALNAQDAWAVGESSDNFSGDYEPLVEHWNGSTWSIATVPEPLNTSLSSVHEFAANDVWAIGTLQNQSTFAYQTYAIHWDGSTWSEVTTPNVGSQNNFFAGLGPSSSNNLWAVGSYYNTTVGFMQTLTEHWNGSSWSAVSSPDVSGVNDELIGAGVVGPRNVWAVGDFGDPINIIAQTLIEHWNGSSWSIVTSPTHGTYSLLRSFAAVARLDDWAFGETITKHVLVPLAEHWNGGRWSIVSVPTVSGIDTTIFASTALGPKDVWAVGSSLGFRDQTFTINWNGSTWTLVPSPNRGTHSNDLFGVSPIPGTLGLWAVGRTGRTPFTFNTMIMKWHC